MTIPEMNVKLDENYEKVNGEPRFRIVWSTGIVEKRYGEFEIISDAGIYLRSEKGVEEVPKYVGEYLDKWILEEYLSTEGNPYLNKVTNYSYEPIWTFGAARSHPEPVWWAVVMLIQSRLDGRSRPVMREKDYKDLEDESRRKEVERNKTILRNETPDIPFALKHGMGIVVPENYKHEENKNG